MSSAFADANLTIVRQRLPTTDSAGRISVGGSSHSTSQASHSALLRNAISPAARASRYLNHEVLDRGLSHTLTTMAAASHNVPQ